MPQANSADEMVTISDKITRALTQQIILGERASGEKLRQDHIARDFETSHVPVREALLRLQAIGLVVSEPRKGMRVAAFDADNIREIHAMRLALEPVALRYSVPKLDAEQIAQAEAARLACDGAGDITAWEESNRAFHLAIIIGCQMPRLLAEIEALQLLNARHVLTTYSKTWEVGTDRDHRAIMQAIKRRDGDGAVAVLKRHLSRLG